MGCSLDLPSTGSAEGLSKRFSTILPEAGQVRGALIVDAAFEFFNKTKRWQYQQFKAEVNADDRELVIDTGGAKGNVQVLNVEDTIFIQGDDCDEEEPITRKAHLTPHGFAKQMPTYSNHAPSDGPSRAGLHRSVSRRDDNLEFYTQDPGHIIFARPIGVTATLRIPMTLAPITIAGIDQIAPEILTVHREGIVALAIVKALEMPGKSWSMPSATFDPDRAMMIYKGKAAEAIKEATDWHQSDDSEFRPHQDRMSVPNEYRDRHYE